jgi:hypothetical protein
MGKHQPWSYWREVLLEEYPDALLALADEIERRGEQGHDRDPGETSDWLRAEVTG